MVAMRTGTAISPSRALKIQSFTATAAGVGDMSIFDFVEVAAVRTNKNVLGMSSVFRQEISRKEVEILPAGLTVQCLDP